ncbi:hypothetical protein [Bradyrhizobium monzae]|uniref:hypothetical protein n=1 Tax=Bradyrhizobium sp. Oc8 TaxID=2876780 RepID=UPI001F2F1157|nr:hypothetical protein [Bradyrhizobium sp. Oc8]
MVDDRASEVKLVIGEFAARVFQLSGAHGPESNIAGLIPTAMLSSMFGRMMPGALERLKEEAPRADRRPNGH